MQGHLGPKQNELVLVLPCKHEFRTALKSRISGQAQATLKSFPHFCEQRQ